MYRCARSRTSHENPILITCFGVIRDKRRFAVVVTQLFTDNGITVAPKRNSKRDIDVLNSASRI